MGETFDDVFPLYLAMGMTWAQFWEQDCTLVVPYRKAYQIRKEDENRFAWLQGMYIYEALCDVSPVMHAFSKPGTRVRPYPEKPYQFEPPQKKTRAEKNIEKQENTVAFMQKLAAQFNRQFEQKRKAERREAAMLDALDSNQQIHHEPTPERGEAQQATQNPPQKE